MVLAGLLHDIGKPGSAHQKDEDVINNEWSFTNHEEASFMIIEHFPFISDYTKNLVRYHYIIRRMAKTKEKDPIEYSKQKAAWDKLTPEFQKEVAMFMKYDDLGKG
jgi:HD superfamily phosphohydrolase